MVSPPKEVLAKVGTHGFGLPKFCRLGPEHIIAGLQPLYMRRG